MLIRYEHHSYPSVNFVLGVISVVLVMHVIRVGRFGPIYSFTPDNIVLSVICVMGVIPPPQFKTVPPHHLQRFDSQTRFFIHPQ